MQLAPAAVATRKCAIYTRKSAQAPIGQEVTSLQSQRSICSSYIASQRHKGWTEIAKAYEDAARSAATLQRPALQELLGDIELGLVDVVLVYKLDRITRTLLDFVRLIDFFDRYGVTFVAITQNFDTSDSMGRLIRNILLTFAQFEREIASDRIRDKEMVMKQRGLWTGGDAPLGYDLRRGRLVVNAQEAQAVRCIFETYVQKRRLAAVHRELAERGFRRKVWRSKGGERRGGNAISLSSLHHVIGNAVYIGEVTHRGERYPGLHEPIVERPLWQRAQAVLAERRLFKPRQPSNLLTGLLFDRHGRRMHARGGCNDHGGFRYYESAHAAWAFRQRIRKTRAQAPQLEQLVIEQLRSLLLDRAQLRLLLMKLEVYGHELDRLAAAGSEAAVRLQRLPVRQLSCVLKAVVNRVEVHSEFVRILVTLEALRLFLLWDGVGLFALSELDQVRAGSLEVLDVQAVVERERKKHCLPVEARTGSAAAPDSRLLMLLEDAREAQRLVFEQREVPVADLAYSLGRKPASFARLVRLNYLAPDIVTAILDGEQPPGLSRRRLMEMDLPTDWAIQRRLLGFRARHAVSQTPPFNAAGGKDGNGQR